MQLFEKHLVYDDLDITSAMLFEQMGYGDGVPDGDVLSEVEQVVAMARRVVDASFCFFVVEEGLLDVKAATLTVAGEAVGGRQVELHVGRIITSQLRGAQGYAFFVATAGVEYERLQHSLQERGDMVKVFIADALGSVIAERVADVMERWLEVFIQGRQWRHTNRFSPGYCGWHVSEQQRLFPLFGVERPCGVTLSESSLMSPIKSVSGVIGVGPAVRKLEYTCGLCDYAKCYKRRLRKKAT